jgi:hypothetical protein
MADSDGKTEDVSDSFSQAVVRSLSSFLSLSLTHRAPQDSDSPKEAAGAEASSSAPAPAGSPGTDSSPAPANAPEPDLKETKQKRGTFKGEGEDGPTDMGTARAAARETAADSKGSEVRLVPRGEVDLAGADGHYRNRRRRRRRMRASRQETMTSRRRRTSRSNYLAVAVTCYGGAPLSSFFHLKMTQQMLKIKWDKSCTSEVRIAECVCGLLRARVLDI